MTDDKTWPKPHVNRLVRAGTKVFDGLNKRIQEADPHAVPVFDGIAELHDALCLPEDSQ